MVYEADNNKHIYKCIHRYILTDRENEIYRLIKMSFYQIELIIFDKII
jgi:hypothetical protein